MKISIVVHKPEFSATFKALNEEWIDQHFVMEAADYKSLDNPEENIINKGGQILYAIADDEPVGVCALIKSENHQYDYELAKMAVKPSHQGNGIGKLLAHKVISAARELGGKTLFLESNTLLEAAIALYRKLGFVEIQDMESPYERSNIQMVLVL